MITQHYKIKATLEHIQEARPGQFVYQSDESDSVVGFVDFVSDCELSIMLFEPTDLDLEELNAVQISETCDYFPRLKDIFAADAQILDMWLSL